MTSQVVLSLIYDMGLHMPPSRQPSKVGQLLKRKGFGLLPQLRTKRTTEDRRALLGAYIITSMYELLACSSTHDPISDQTNSACRTCSAFRSADGLRWSSYLDECLNYVAENGTEVQDQILIAQVKLQLIINQLRSAGRGGTGMETPIGYLDALRLQLDDIVTPTSGVSTTFDNNCKLALILVKS